MKKAIFIITILAIIFAFRNPFQEPKHSTIEQFYQTTRFNGGMFSFDEKNLLIGSNQTGIFNAFQITVNGGKAIALTHSTTESIYPISYFPFDNRILYSSNRPTKER